MTNQRLISFGAMALSLSLTASMSLTANAADAKRVRIGFSMDTLKEERWQRDRDMFVQRAKELGAEVLVQAANGNAAMQVSQAENLLTQQIDVLVVVPSNAVTAAAIVEKAHKAGKKSFPTTALLKTPTLIYIFLLIMKKWVGCRQSI